MLAQILENSIDPTPTLASLRDRVSNIVLGKPEASFSLWRNQNLKGQTLVINPGEELVGDVDVGPGTYRVCVVGDGYVSKETRIVDPKDGKFSNPVYEFFETKGLPELSNVVIKAGPAVKHPEALKKWKMEEPASPEVDYYLTFELLAEGKLDEFRNRGEYFLFRKKTQDVSVLMMRYYLGCSWLNKNPNKAAGYFLSGLEARPLMSEFWCGLGDCLRLTGQGNKAIRLYKNALIVGARRPAGDEPPVILDYYGDYPRRRIEGR